MTQMPFLRWEQIVYKSRSCQILFMMHTQQSFFSSPASISIITNMISRPAILSSLLPFLLLRDCSAQSGPGVYRLDAVPTSACVGKAGQGTATYSTGYALATSVHQLNIYSGKDYGYAKQAGGQWKICNGSFSPSTRI